MDKKQKHKHGVLIVEKLDDIGADMNIRLENHRSV
jgi:hypothetical protein